MNTTVVGTLKRGAYRAARQMLAATALAAALACAASARESLLLYWDAGTAAGTSVITWSDGNVGEFDGVSADLVAPEGANSFSTLHFSWAGWGLTYAAPQDLSRFAGGQLRFWIYANTSDIKIEVEKSGGTKVSLPLTSCGWTAADLNKWKHISVPLSSFGALNAVKSPFLISQNSGGWFYVDFIRYTEGLALDTLYVEPHHRDTHAGVSSISWTASDNVSWKPADTYLKVDFDPGTTYWHLRMYTDNTNAAAVPRYIGTGDPAGLLISTGTMTTAAPLPVTWTVEDETRTLAVLGSAAPETWITGGGAFKVLMDRNYSNFDNTYATFWDKNGVEWGTHTGQRGWKNTPNYLYFGTDFGQGRAGRTYETRRLMIELYYD